MAKHDMFPNVYVRKITLTSAGGKLRNIDNPHVSDDFEIEQKRTQFSTTIQQRADRKKTDASGTGMKVELRLVLKDIRSEETDISQWFDRKVVSKYLKIRVVQSIDKEITRSIMSNIETLNQQHFKRMGELGKATIKTISLNSAPNTSFRSEDRAFEINYSATFTLRDARPDHLTYFVSTFLDIEAMETDFEMDLQSESFKTASSKTVVENVISSGKIVSQAYLFVDKGGVVWTGPVMSTGSSFYKMGTVEPLSATRVPTNVVQDFRQRGNGLERRLNFRAIEKELLDNAVGLFDSAIARAGKKPPLFTELWCTRDKDGNARFMFGLDFNKLLETEALFGSLLNTSNQDRIAEIHAFSNIVDMKIFRHRIKNTTTRNRLGVESISTEAFDKSAPELVVGGKFGLGLNVMRADFNGNGILDRSGTLREVRLRFKGVAGIRHFTVMDDAMSWITDGVYRYSVELDVKDGTVEFMEEQMAKLVDIGLVLDQFHQQANLPSNYDIYTQTYTKKFIDEQTTLYPKNDRNRAPWVSSVSDFFDVMNLMFDNFDNTKFDVIYPLVNLRQGNPEGIMMFAGVVNGLIRVMERSMERMGGTSNRSGRFPQAVSLKRSGPFARLKINVVHSFNGTFDSNLKKNVGKDMLSFEDADGEMYSPTSDDGLVIISGGAYQERVDKETLKYFNATEATIDIVSDYKSYTKDDSLSDNSWTYFSPSVVKLEDYGEVRLLTDSPSAWEQEKYTNISISVFGSAVGNKQAPTGKDNDTPGTRTNNLTQILALKSLVVASEGELLNGGTDNSEEVVPLTEIMPKSSKISKEKFDDSSVKDMSEARKQETQSESVFVALTEQYKENNTKTRTRAAADASSSPHSNTEGTNDVKILSSGKGHDTKQKRSQKEEAMSKDFFDLRKRNNALDKTQMTSKEVKALPNQVKSILIGGLEDSSNLVKQNPFIRFGSPAEFPAKHSGNFAMFQFNYLLLSVVEILVGYENTNGPSVKAPLWEKLTLDKYNTALGGELLCRIRRYDNPLITFGFAQTIEEQLPTYNQFFIIQPEHPVEKEIKKKSDWKEAVAQIDIIKDLIPSEYLNTGVFEPDFKTRALFDKAQENLESGGVVTDKSIGEVTKEAAEKASKELQKQLKTGGRRVVGIGDAETSSTNARGRGRFGGPQSRSKAVNDAIFAAAGEELAKGGAVSDKSIGEVTQEAAASASTVFQEEEKSGATTNLSGILLGLGKL